MASYLPTRHPSQDASQPLQQGVANSTSASAYCGTPSGPHQQAGTTSSSAASASDTPLPWDFVYEITVKPIIPPELPKMLEGLRKIGELHPHIITGIKSSGEHVVHGTSELYMDFVLDDLRRLYADMKIKVSGPVMCMNDRVEELWVKESYAAIPEEIAGSASASDSWPLGLSCMPPGRNNHKFSCCLCVAAGREVKEEWGGGLCPTCRHHQCPNCDDRELPFRQGKPVRFPPPMGLKKVWQDTEDPGHLGHFGPYLC